MNLEFTSEGNETVPYCPSKDACSIVNLFLDDPSIKDFRGEPQDGIEEFLELTEDEILRQDRKMRFDILQSFLHMYKGATQEEIILAINKLTRLRGKES